MTEDFVKKFEVVIKLKNYEEIIDWLLDFDRSSWSIKVPWYLETEDQYFEDLIRYVEDNKNKLQDEDILGVMPVIVTNKSMAIQFRLTWI